MKTNKVIITIAVLAVTIIAAMTLSAFTTYNNSTVAENEYTLAANDGWKLFRENVPYCDGDKDMCEGYGIVWVNTDTYQVAFSLSQNGKKYDLSEYTDKKGYNMRFWYNSKYHYINVYIPNAVFN